MSECAMEEWTWSPHYDEAYRPPAGQAEWFPQRETMPAEQRDELDPAAHPAGDGVRLGAITLLPPQMGRGRRPPVLGQDAGGLRAGPRSSQGRVARRPGHARAVRQLSLRRARPRSSTSTAPRAPPAGRRHSESSRSGLAEHRERARSRAVGDGHPATRRGAHRLTAEPLLGSWGVYIGAERLGARSSRSVPESPARPHGPCSGCSRWASPSSTARRPTPCGSSRWPRRGRRPGRARRPRKLFFSGEPGASMPSIRSRIVTGFGAARCTTPEAWPKSPPGCTWPRHRNEPGVFCWQDLVYTEVCDPRRPARVPYGSEGTPVYTTLERTSQPMIRLLSNDLPRGGRRPPLSAAALTHSSRTAFTVALTICSSFAARTSIPVRSTAW